MSLTLPDGLQAETRTLNGWGRTNPVTTQVVQPRSLEQLRELVHMATPRSLIARGLGRSYGDAAQLKNGLVIELPALNQIALDRVSGTVTTGAGVSLDQLLRVLVPAGFFLPVTPGTRNITVGGAIAADVHGKNHHLNGSFGNHVQRLLLIDGRGGLRVLTQDGGGNSEEADDFWATVGGMGLTGVIVEATLSLIPITSSLISVCTSRFGDVESLMTALKEADANDRYTVAWVDSLDPRGRGVLTCGNHVPVEVLTSAQQANPLQDAPTVLASMPPALPRGLLNPWTVRAFNEAWYRKAPKKRKSSIQAMTPFFYPLDGVQNWNRLYGPAGFLQYQFAVPDQAAHLVPRTLEALRHVGAPSFLTVLKRLGPSNPAPLSFPIPGWTLAADVPAALPGLLEVLDRLDQEIAASGGRLYLAKDSRQSAEMFKACYPNLAAWRATRSRLDPLGRFRSSLADRLIDQGSQ